MRELLESYKSNLKNAKYFLEKVHIAKDNFAFGEGTKHFDKALLDMQKITANSSDYTSLYAAFLLKIIDAIEIKEEL